VVVVVTVTLAWAGGEATGQYPSQANHRREVLKIKIKIKIKIRIKITKVTRVTNGGAMDGPLRILSSVSTCPHPASQS
jgi:hypothetical protein